MVMPVAQQLGHKIYILWPHISKTQRPINFKISAYIQNELPVTRTLKIRHMY